MINILEFINNFKKDFNIKEIEKCFTEGNCYHFATILKNMYPKSEIYHNDIENHFFVILQDVCYDITGTIYPNLKNCSKFEDLKNFDRLYYDRLVEQCGYKYYREDDLEYEEYLKKPKSYNLKDWNNYWNLNVKEE